MNSNYMQDGVANQWKQIRFTLNQIQMLLIFSDSFQSSQSHFSNNIYSVFAFLMFCKFFLVLI